MDRLALAAPLPSFPVPLLTKAAAYYRRFGLPGTGCLVRSSRHVHGWAQAPGPWARSRRPLSPRSSSATGASPR
ncbi:hypothetical protein, partial [Halomicronema sp. CCY15110]|uniref:hypothetical protein n=1 Tax=Halomicronema sp. CCY15110 TaxID=2767773 RepID=UPI0019506193